MPLVQESHFRPALWLRSGHVNTLYGGVLRDMQAPAYVRERITTPDDDFLDLDWFRQGHRRVAILSHGLEGNSRRTYMNGMARHLGSDGWDVLAWNYRGCSGEPNRTLRTYHSGATEDLDAVVRHARNGYEGAGLVGFSLGGNLTLKYLGEMGEHAPVQAAVVFSVPCDLASGSRHLARRRAAPYMARFMRSLRRRVRQKAAMFPGRIETRGLDAMRTFREFDDAYTAPLNGFQNAEDYWARASCKPYIRHIRVPTLVVSAQDDPFLPPECYPVEEAGASQSVTLETPQWGGHVGFAESRNRFWSERRASGFLASATE